LLARWIAKDDTNNNHGLKAGTDEVESIDGSDDDEEDGYFSDKGNNTLSIIFAKDDRERMKRSGIDNSDSNTDDRVDPTNEMRKWQDGSRDERDGDEVNNNSKRRRNKASRVEGREESQGSNDDDSTVGRGRQVNRENGVDSPAKNTRGRSSKRN
jgi:hypothetical protein